MMPQDCSFLPDWVCPSSCSQSPVSESYSLSSSYSSPPSKSFLQDPMFNVACHQTEKTPPTSTKTRCKMIGPQRYNASEREKMRMRNLSKALHNLRRYLPPSLVPVGRNLTKIETLRLTISYISYLSQLLGFNEETLRQRRDPQQDVNVTHLKMPERYQELTCRHHYQHSQQQPQSLVVHELPRQCENFRISPTQHKNIQMEGDNMSSSVYNKRHMTVTDCNPTSPYTSRFTHFHQAAEHRTLNQHLTHLPYIRESDSCLRKTDPRLTFINGLQTSSSTGLQQCNKERNDYI